MLAITSDYFQSVGDPQPYLKRIASSAYQECVNLEVVIRETGIQDEAEFLSQAHTAGEKLTQLNKKPAH